MNAPQLIQAATLAVHLMRGKAFPALYPMSGWEDIVQRLTSHEEREDKDGAGVVCAEFLSPHRASANVAAYTALTLDIEGKDAEDLPPPPEEVADRLRRHNLEGVVYTSHNHLTPPEMNGGKPASPRYRVIVPLSATLPPADLARQTDALAASLELSAWLDPASRTVSQFFYLPSCRPGAPRFAARIHGEPWDAAAPAALPEIMPTRGGGHRLDFTPLPPSSGERGFDAVRKAAQGQWRGVLSRLGISVPDTAKHAPCPGCGGRDRFRFDDKDGGGSFICGQGGAGTLAGDGFALVQHVRHCSAADALALVRDVVMPSSGGRTRQERPANDEPEVKAHQKKGTREKPQVKPAKAYSIADFLSIKLPPRINLLSPWMPAQGLAMVYAPRGIGKTFFGLNVAYAVASGGSFLCWKAEAPMRVMYIDGEMPAVTMQERLAAIVNSHEAEAEADALLIVTPDMQDGEPMPDLSTIEGQAAIAPLLEGVRLIVVDNISTLCRTGTENESDSWDVVQMWALKQRSAGRSVLFVHHAGKTGAQRGTSKREDVLDTVIALRRPGDYTPGQGAAFEVHFEKARGFSGDEAEPMLCALDEDEHGRAAWTWRKLELATFDKVVSLANEGLTPIEIAEHLDIHKSNVSRHLKKARAQGLVEGKRP